MAVEGEVLIVGGGVAGLAVAIQLGVAGRRVLVVDKAPLPRDKVCGEGLMPMGLAALQALGLDASALPGAPFQGLEYRSRRQRVPLNFRPQVLGRGVRRTALIAALHGAATALPTVSRHADRVREPIRQAGRIVGAQGERATYRAPVVLAADGVHSSLARRAGLPLRVYGKRMALRRHFRLAPGVAVPRVCVGLFAPHDLYLTPVGDNTLLATTMTDRAGYRAIAHRYDAFLREGPYADLFAGAEPVSQQLGWHHPLFSPRHYAVEGMLLVGDAGGGVDPCLGVGISMALASAEFAARAALALLEAPAEQAQWIARYEGECKILFQHFNAFGRVMRALVRSRRGGALLVQAMRHWPGAAESLLDIVARGSPWRTFTWPALLRPVRPANRAGAGLTG